MASANEPMNFLIDQSVDQDNQPINNRRPVQDTNKHYHCQTCGAGFKYAVQLRAHQLVHVNPSQRPLACSFCPKRFTNANALKIHESSHTGEKPFECDDCHKQFRSRGNLTLHRRTHTGERPFKCMHCGSAFAGGSDLTKHMRTHTREKPYKCADCEYAAAVSCDLRRHVQSKHKRELPKFELYGRNKPRTVVARAGTSLHVSTTAKNTRSTKKRKLSGAPGTNGHMHMQDGDRAHSNSTAATSTGRSERRARICSSLTQPLPTVQSATSVVVVNEHSYATPDALIADKTDNTFTSLKSQLARLSTENEQLKRRVHMVETELGVERVARLEAERHADAAQPQTQVQTRAAGCQTEAVCAEASANTNMDTCKQELEDYDIKAIPTTNTTNAEPSLPDLQHKPFLVKYQ